MTKLIIKKSLFTGIKKYFINDMQVSYSEFENFKDGLYCELIEDNHLVRIYKIK